MTKLNKILHFSNAMLNAATLDDLLWSIANNIGETLGFDDCVVYLNVDGTLVQKAAFGIKNPKDRNLLNEIVIALGQGIVGVVAQSQEAEIISDTSVDERYIRDEFSGKSELTVPIIYENRTIGIIDSESASYNNYTQNDKELLQVIANIAAPRIASAQYCSQLEKTQIQLEETNVELASSLRKLQKNQNALIQTEKMASIGVLASGVAHEINNPIGFIKSNLSILKEYFEDIESYYQDSLVNLTNDTQKTIQQHLAKKHDIDFLLSDIPPLLEGSIGGVDRVIEIVQNLKTFARVDQANRSLTDINEGIHATLNMVRNELKFNCNIHIDLEPLPKIMVYPGKLNQVVMNLLINAGQSIDEKGDVFIRTSVHNNSIVIDIEDTGSGIDSQHQSQIFTPFYTTKVIGEGTGLGLSISHQIIEQHDGEIKVTSTLGKGSCFSVYLPINT